MKFPRLFPSRPPHARLSLLSLFLVVALGPGLLPGAETKDKKEKSSGGLMNALLGSTIRRGIGLSEGDFVEFNLSRIRIVNARMEAPPLTADTNRDTTFLKVDEIVVDYSPLDVLNKKLLKRVQIIRPQIWLSQLQQKITAPADPAKATPPAPATAKKEKSGETLLIQRLELSQVSLYLDTLRTQGINIPLHFAQEQPIILEQLHISDLLNHPTSDQLVTISADHVRINSAYGPMAPLVSIEQLTLGFTWKGLFQKEIESLTVTEPSLHIGDDWFLLLNEFQKAPSPAAPDSMAKAAPSTPGADPAAEHRDFLVKQFRIARLRLTLSSYGIDKFSLPFSFNYAADNVSLDKDGRFFLTSRLTIDERDFALPEYNLGVHGLVGDIRFNWPPTDSQAENIVPSLKADTLTLKNLHMTHPWIAFTFTTGTDKPLAAGTEKTASKAYLNFGTELYGGYVKGGVAAEFDQSWQAWLSGTSVSMDAINAFRAQPISGVFLVKLKAGGRGTAVNDCQVELQNERGNSLRFNLAGDLSEFYKDVAGPPLSDTPAELNESDVMAELSQKQRARSGEIQQLKNNRLAGENNQGLLEARVKTIEQNHPGAAALIVAENEGRKTIYRFIAARRKTTLAAVQEDYARMWQERAFPGEWTQNTDGSWQQR